MSHYAKSFPKCGRDVLTVDGTPDYINEEQALQNIADSYGPQRLAKTTFAVLLCDPVQRAFSAVNHFGLGSFRWESHLRPLGNPGGDIRNIWLRGVYAPQVDTALRILGQLAIISSDVYYQDAARTIAALLALVRARSGKSPQHTSKHASKAPHSNSHAHASLSQSMDVLNDGPYLSQHYRTSNRHIYDMVQSGKDARVSVIPPHETWPKDLKDYFLESSAALKPFAHRND